jgi:hypothetical protein
MRLWRVSPPTSTTFLLLLIISLHWLSYTTHEPWWGMRVEAISLFGLPIGTWRVNRDPAWQVDPNQADRTAYYHRQHTKVVCTWCHQSIYARTHLCIHIHTHTPTLLTKKRIFRTNSCRPSYFLDPPVSLQGDFRFLLLMNENDEVQEEWWSLPPWLHFHHSKKRHGSKQKKGNYVSIDLITYCITHSDFFLFLPFSFASLSSRAVCRCLTKRPPFKSYRLTEAKNVNTDNFSPPLYPFVLRLCLFCCFTCWATTGPLKSKSLSLFFSSRSSRKT